MLGFLIDVLDTSKYHCVYVVPKHALKCMIMCNSHFDHNYLKKDISTCPTIIFYLFLTQIIYIIYHSVVLSLLYYISRRYIFLGGAIHIFMQVCYTILVVILISVFSIISH